MNLYRRQHPQPPVLKGWLSRASPFPRKAIDHILREADISTVLADCLSSAVAGMLVDILSSDGIHETLVLGGAQVAPGHDSHSNPKALHSMLHVLLNVWGFCAAACPSEALVAYMNTLATTLKVARAGVESLHNASALLTNLLASAPATSLSLLNWATSSGSMSGQRGTKRRIDGISDTLPTEQEDDGIRFPRNRTVGGGEGEGAELMNGLWERPCSVFDRHEHNGECRFERYEGAATMHSGRSAGELLRRLTEMKASCSGENVPVRCAVYAFVEVTVLGCLKSTSATWWKCPPWPQR